MAILSPLSPLRGLGSRHTPQVSGLPMTGLSAWYKADSLLGTLVDNDEVTTWNDSVNGFTATSGPTAPHFKTNVQNGNPSVDLTGSAWLYGLDNLAAAGSARTIVVAAYRASEGGGSLVSIRRSTVYQTAMIFVYSGTTYINGDGVSGTANVSVVCPISVGNYITTHVYHGSGNNLTFYVNGVSYSASPGSEQTTESGSDGFHIGYNPAGQAWPGAIYEILFYDHALNNTERWNAEAYLNTKYAIF